MPQEKRRTFFSTCFSKKCSKHTQQIYDVITEVGFDCCLGKDFGGGSISESVKSSIASSALVIGLIERPNNRTREPSQWVVQELAMAAALKIPCLLLLEEGVRFSRGLLGDVEYIHFATSNFSAVFPLVLRQLNVILRKQGFEMGIKDVSAPWLHILPQPRKEDCNDMARAEMKTASMLTLSEQFEQALEHARNAVALDKTCWQAWIKYGGLLLATGSLAEGVKIHHQIQKDFRGNKAACAAAKHNLAVELELRFGLGSTRANNDTLPLYECSLRLDPSRLHTRADLICLYLRLNRVNDAHTLLDESGRYEGFIRVLRKELDKSPDGLKLIPLLPTLAQNMLYPIRHSDFAN